MTADGISIRNETGNDHAAISRVTEEAFRDMEISSHTEQFIIAALRKARALSVSLVAELDNRIIGHAAFSPVTVSDGTEGWFGLGPVSVRPDFQRRGIGTALIKEGLSRLRADGAKGCCLVGHPEYYRRFGFMNTTELTLDGVPPEVFFVLPFKSDKPHGTVSFHEAFQATDIK